MDLGSSLAASSWVENQFDNSVALKSASDFRTIFVESSLLGNNVLTEVYLSSPSSISGDSYGFCSTYYYSGIVGNSYALTRFDYGDSNKSFANIYNRVVNDPDFYSSVKSSGSVVCGAMQSPSNLRRMIPIYIPISNSNFIVLGSLGGVTATLTSEKLDSLSIKLNLNKK